MSDLLGSLAFAVLGIGALILLVMTYPDKPTKAQPMSDKHGKPDELSPEAEAINNLTQEIKSGLEWFRSHAGLATKQDLREMESKILMTFKEAFQALLASTTQFNARVETAIQGVVTSLAGVTESVAGVTEDIATLNEKIAEIQTSGGPISADDQTALDAAQAAGSALAEKVEAANTALSTANDALKALDALTPPKTPPTPTEG